VVGRYGESCKLLLPLALLLPPPHVLCLPLNLCSHQLNTPGKTVVAPAAAAAAAAA
jgi:hypothetical protein